MNQTLSPKVFVDLILSLVQQQKTIC